MILYLHFGPQPEPIYHQLLATIHEFTPATQALPPDAALADVSGSMRYFDRDATGLAALIRMRAAAALDVDATVGIAPNPLLAQLAAHRGAPGTIRAVPDDPEAITTFLTGLPAGTLPGVGPATAHTLASYGLSTADQIAATPLLTLQRILGAAAGRQLHQRASGIDPTRVTPGAPPRTYSAEHRFVRDELDSDRQHDTLTHLAEHLGARLRGEHQACQSLTLTVQYANHSTTTRSRTLAEPTAHSPQLRAEAHALHKTLGLQRARVRRLTLRAGDLCDAGSVSRQLVFGLDNDKARRIEAAADRAQARFGPGTVRPASTAGMV
ncbi:DNA polymerase [Streptomyces sp. 150FB]|uniref:DNA polymerase Y family protein n=1 Tax=Streptomyces sp. 150FB TaxID=1576605 RepID=UPI00058943FE|nr:DNA polymerase [Streptomyces sp. 150FB]KIF73795.1 DNA polymerase [Streptomyces sp. 150FB]